MVQHGDVLEQDLFTFKASTEALIKATNTDSIYPRWLTKSFKGALYVA